MKYENKSSAVAPYIGYIYQHRLALYLSFQISEAASIYIEKADDIEILTENEKNHLIQVKHKKKSNSQNDKSIDFWKSVGIWLDFFNKNQESNFFLYTTNEFDNTSILKKLCANKTNIFSLEDIENLIKKVSISKNKIIKPIIDKIKLIDRDKLIIFFNAVTILENQLFIKDVRQKVIDFHLRQSLEEHRVEIYNELEGWWTQKVIELMESNTCITVKEITLKIFDITQKFFPKNLPSPNEFNDDIDYSGFLDNQYLFIKKVQDIKLKKNQIKWCILDYFKTNNDRRYWIENALLTWDELSNYERTLLSEWNRVKDSLYDEEDKLSNDEIITLGQNLFNWSQNFNHKIRPHVQALHICRGTFHIISDDDKRNLFWLPKLKQD